MSECPICGHPNPAGATRCETCGATLEEPPARNSAAKLSPPSDDELGDPLAGLEGLLPAPKVAAPGALAEPPPEGGPDEGELAEAALLGRIATEPAPLGQPRRTQAAAAPARPSPVVRRLLYVLVLLAALAPLFASGLAQAWVRPRPQVARLAEELASIPAGGRVLVAFDYAPGYSGELDPLAERVLAGLARRGVSLVALGTRPEGVGLARRVLGRAIAGVTGYRYGAEYVILGFLPGEESGLRLLAQDLPAILPQDDVLRLPLARLPVTQNVTGLGDFQAVLLLSDDANGARRWVEQVATQSDAPTYALATARIEPLLAPYLQSGQLVALVGGAYGAQEFPLGAAPEQGGLHGSEGYIALWGVFVVTAVLANLGHRHKG